MLRELVLALVTALAVATTITSYEAGHDYLYRYEVITSSALRAANHQTAGLKIKTNVRFQLNNDRRVNIKFESPELCKVHQEVPAAETVETVFEHSCTPVTGEEANTLKQELTKPFSAKWESGIPTELHVESGEKYWSVNIKRGFLNMLRLNLKEENTIDSLYHLSDETRQHILQSGNSRAGQLNATYRGYEEDMVGNCESIYSVFDDEYVENEFYVSKVRNYDNCLNKPMLRKGLFANMNDVYPQLEENTALKTLSHADFKVEGNRNTQYIIKSGYLTNHFSLRPIEDVESAYTSTHQRINLLSVTSLSNAITTASNMESVPIYKFYMPIELTTSSEVEPEMITYDDTTDYSRYLRELASASNEELDISFSEKILKISTLLQKLPLAEMKQFMNEFMVPGESDENVLKRREILLDILPTLNRPDVIPYITELFKQNVISAPRTVIMINMATLTVTPSPRVFRDLMVLVKDPAVTQYPMFKKSVLFNVGTIANKIRNMYVEMNVTDTVSNPEMNNIKENLVALWNSVESPREKMDIVTLYGNAGLLNLFPTIEGIIQDPATPDYLRSKAIFSLRKMCNIIPLEVQRILLPIFADEKQEAHVRVSAFLISMKTNPSFGVMQTITHDLKKEINVEVLSFVCSYLDTIVTSEDPHMRNMTSTIKTALENVYLVHGGLLNSGIYSFEKFIKRAGPIGGDIRLTLFNNGFTPLPDSAILHFRTALFGKRFDLGQMGIMTSGLKDLFWNMYGPENRLKDFLSGSASFQDLMRPLTELVSKLVGSVENINSKFSTAERNMVSEKMVELYTKIFDYEMFSVNHNDDEIVELYNKIKNYLPQIVTTLNSEYRMDFTRTISAPQAASLVLPTPAGIPVHFNIATAAHMKFTGKVRLEGLSSLSALMQIASGNMPEFTLRTELSPNTIFTTVMHIGSYLPFLSTKAAMKIDAVNKFSTKAQLTVAPNDKRIKFAIETPKQEGSTDVMTLFRVDVTPFTEFIRYPLRQSTSSMPFYEVMVVNTVPNVHWGTPIFGRGVGFPVKIITEYPSVLKPMKPHTFFVSPMWVEFQFFPNLDTADKFEFEFEYFAPGESSAAHHHGVAGLSFDHIHAPEEFLTDKAHCVCYSTRMINSGATEKEIKMKFTHMYDISYLKQLLDVQVISSPLRTDNISPMKFVFQSFLYVPEFFTKFVDSTPVHDESERDSRLFSTTYLKFGFNDNNVENVATIKNYWTREITDTTINRMLEATTPYTFTKHIPQMFRNVSALQGIVNSTLLHKMWHETPTNMPLVFTTEVEYMQENIPKPVKYVLPTVYEMAVRVPYYFSKEATVLTLPAWNEQGHVVFNTTFDPFLEQIKLKVQLPTQSRTVYGLPLPMPYIFKKMLHTPTFPLFRAEVMEGDIPSGWCSVTQNNYIHTFDMLSTKLPNHQCEIVLAKDCSALNIFMVTMKPTDTGKRIITVYLPDKKVEIIPATGRSFTVKINDEVIQMPTDNTPHTIEDATETQVLKFIARRNKVFVTSWKYGLTVETDGTSAFVKPSDLYRGQLCGACSDFESSLYNELRGPNNELYSIPIEFLESYVIRSSGCEVPLVANSCETIQRNVIVERFVKGVMKTCIGIEPINQCSGTCVPREPRQISQTFRCWNSNTDRARNKRKQAEAGPITLSAGDDSFKEIVTEYQTCY